jgi:glutamate-1-semialdehyde 2,1-aminomutase
MAAGLAALETLALPEVYAGLERTSAALEQGLIEVLGRHGNVARVDRVASIFYLWFKPNQTRAARSYEEIKTADAALYGRFFNALLDEGVALAPSAFEVGFVSTAHNPGHIDAAVTAVDRALAKVLGR